MRSIMKSVAGILAWTAIVAGGVAAGAGPAGDLDQGFVDPPDSAKPHTWWHWMNGNVTKEGITADLDAMKRAGIGGAQIFNVSESIPDGPAPFMSPEWLDLFRHAAAEADRLGIELCFHNCAGWSSSGGPWIQPEHAMQIAAISETGVQGPARFDDFLPQPEIRKEFYRDIAVLAFPTPADNDWRIPDIRAKAGFEARYGMQPDAAAAPGAAAIAKESVIDLSARLQPGGRLAWDVPAGEWTILRIGHTPTGKDNHPSPEAGRGLECDKLSREALDSHWAGGIAPILAKLGPLAGRSVNNCLIDSYEVGCNNWTPRFRDEFAKRRGYDLLPYLPALSGRVIDSLAITERFLRDFRRTIADLFADNYFGYFCELCREHGLLASVEPYDGPFECLAVAAASDIVMGEFWVGGGEPSSCKLAAAAAHTHGQRIAGAESFTAVPESGRWQNHPGSLKALGDLIWCSGINRFIFHRYAHQPWLDKFPGMTMGQWGTHFERTNTWWEQSTAWMKYLARSQYLLQQGKAVADVLFFGGEAAPNGMVHRPDLKAKGYDYDAIGTDLIDALAVADGRVVLPSGMSYRLLVMPDTVFMTPELARKVRDLVAAGAAVMAPRPEMSPSLTGFPDCDAEVAAIAEEVWGDWGEGVTEHAFGKGRVVWGPSAEETLAAMGVRPDFEAAPAGSAVAFIHRDVDGADLYFVSNQEPRTADVRCTFRVAGKLPELFDPAAGRTEPAALWRQEDGRTTVHLHLDPAGSVFVVFRKAAPAGADPMVSIEHTGGGRPPSPRRPAASLEIKKALYGVTDLAAAGVVDVTAKLAALVADSRLTVKASNDIAGDPKYLVVKKLAVEYSYGGKPGFAIVKEGETLALPAGAVPAEAPGAAGPAGLKIVRAVYGALPDGLAAIPKPATVDVAEKLAALVNNGALSVVASDALAGSDPVPALANELYVEYVHNGIRASARAFENEKLEIPAVSWKPEPLVPQLTAAAGGGLQLRAWDGGSYSLKTASGADITVEVPPVPAPMEIEGAWEAAFPAGWGAPEKAAFERLVSWPEHEDAGIRYFSGTATYRKTIVLPAELFATGRELVLDLGRVEVIAEVALNGKNLGILWKPPFRVDITAASRPGNNTLEVRVTNLWPNRLIGDEQLPDDCEWAGKPLKSWPAWLLEGRPRPSSGRFTFTTWKHWTKAEPLLPSGLIGPVTVHAAARASVPR